MTERNLKPSIPPTRSDVLITLIAKSDPESRLIKRHSLETTLRGLARAGQVGAEDFRDGGARGKILASLSHLESNGLILDGAITEQGIEYAAQVDTATQYFVGGFVAGAEHMEDRHRDC
jgi:hypothetical protein